MDIADPHGIKGAEIFDLFAIVLFFICDDEVRLEVSYFFWGECLWCHRFGAWYGTRQEGV